MRTEWLQNLKLDQLHRLASLTGSYCSGTKAVRIASIEQGLRNTSTILTAASSNGNNGQNGQNGQNGELRIVSIDMGIRNLAYCTLQAQSPRALSTSPDTIKLGEWRRMEVASAISAYKKPMPSFNAKQELAAKESFEPYDYARHAYSIIKRLVDEHDPTHVLIERQRYRSGGGSAVQEWTIRVGVFEAMLYATLRTLKEQKYTDCMVSPMAPTMVNRFWFQELEEEGDEKSKSKPKSRRGPGSKVHPGDVKRRKQADTKRLKIRLLQQLLGKQTVEGARLALSNEALAIKDDFLAQRLGPQSQQKLDDLADSLLQGLAWISWQRNRLNLQSIAKREFGGFDL